MYAARRANLERALEGEEVSYEVEFPRSGGVAFTEVVHVPHRDARGQVLGVYVVVTDLTQHKLSERALSESESRFRAIANSAPVLIWVTGADEQPRIRQSGLPRLFWRHLRGGAGVRLAQGPPSRRSAAHPQGGADRRAFDEAGHGRGPLPPRRRGVAVAAGGISAPPDCFRRARRVSSASPTTSPRPSRRRKRLLR